MQLMTLLAALSIAAAADSQAADSNHSSAISPKIHKNEVGIGLGIYNLAFSYSRRVWGPWFTGITLDAGPEKPYVLTSNIAGKDYSDVIQFLHSDIFASYQPNKYITFEEGITGVIDFYGWPIDGAGGLDLLVAAYGAPQIGNRYFRAGTRFSVSRSIFDNEYTIRWVPLFVRFVIPF